ncbi:thioredoxin domain-containing protein [Polycladomyces abyssicola]|uniref:Thioredoxin domain-containing protein n=1 Tax=Polycladomyces abyssicola TaxID=1125966 RepID=A0A8D5ZJY4_9BACL|nr:thioredoxin domain-containing protein [Polycladomyces abyssicola]BCU80954.1 thioredoxin domain-containing protein [Polycladomyces abyssicola]
MTKTQRKPNRLIHEKSPYLLQHAYNPVDWYPWGEEAFEKAKREDKPIFLSIGYSTCHWCHVMERESFEDPEVAEVLNRDFVSIKVDREERPDVDHIYMTVCQAITGHGGWPLTIIMTPDKKPFFAGTYFPKESRYGRRGLMEILQRIAVVWKQDRSNMLRAGDKITELLEKNLDPVAEGELTAEVLDRAFEQFRSQFDPRWGGFGDAPKFPRPHDFLFLLRYWKRTGNQHALEMVERTLTMMHRGGIYDHLGYGFARYSVDERWLVPHFEKMLYDNALLALAYLEAYQATGKEIYAQVAREIFTYVLRDMTDPEGGFYSAEDADSEGEEGKFYVWTPEEIQDVLGEADGELFVECYGVTPEGNFEGKNILNLLDVSWETIATRKGMTLHELERKMSEAREKLFEVREKRVHPHKDDKVLTSWNGLMIAALARGGRVLGDERYTAAAEKAVSFIWRYLRREDGRLLARYRDGEAAYLAYVDDYAYLAWGLLELYEAGFDVSHLEKAIELTHQMLDLFADEEKGGLFFYGRDAEQLLTRPKEVYDGALPSGNSVAACNLIRLARMTGDPEWESQAERQLRAFGETVKHSPIAHSFFLTAAQWALGPTKEIVIVGKKDAEDTRQMIQQAHRTYLPDAVLLFKPEGEPTETLDTIAPFTKEQHTLDGRATVYVCENHACHAPATKWPLS